jgi:hypothetical protein
MYVKRLKNNPHSKFYPDNDRQARGILTWDSGLSTREVPDSERQQSGDYLRA